MDLSSTLQRVELRQRDTQLVLTLAAAFGSDHPDLAFGELERRLGLGERLVWETGRQAIRLGLPFRARLRGGATRFEGACGQTLQAVSAVRREGAFAKLLRSAHQLQREADASPFSSPEDLRAARGPQASYYRRLGRLAFLAPDLQRALLAGEHPRAFNYERLMDESLPLAWADQRAWMHAIRP